MRSLVLACLIMSSFAGCLGPTAAELAPEAPPPRPVNTGVWRYVADADVAEPIVDAATAWTRNTGHTGAEPNIGITDSGAIFMTAFDATIRSRAAGQDWEVVYDFEPQFGPGSDSDTGDPMLWVDPVTDRVYTNHMYPSLVCFATAWSEDEGGTWTENYQTCTLPGVDHQKFFSAPPGPLAPSQAGVAHATVLYQCYQRVVGTDATGFLASGFATFCNMSYDGGENWNAETLSAARTPGSCGGINGHPAAAPDGTVVVPITRGCDGLWLSVTLDSGLTWTMRQGPTVVGAESIDPDVAFTPDGTLYAIWRGSDHLTYLARSPDVGLSWDGPWRVNLPDTTSTVFQAISAGDDGRIAMAYLGTSDSAAYPSDAEPDTVWHLYITTSEDADGETPTLTTHQVTHNSSPVQVGCVWLEGGGNPCRNMLDFIDSAAHPDGSFYVAYTKGCGGCASDRDRTSDTAIATIRDWSLWGDGQDAPGQEPDNVTSRVFKGPGGS